MFLTGNKDGLSERKKKEDDEEEAKSINIQMINLSVSRFPCSTPNKTLLVLQLISQSLKWPSAPAVYSYIVLKI